MLLIAFTTLLLNKRQPFTVSSPSRQGFLPVNHDSSFKSCFFTISFSMTMYREGKYARLYNTILICTPDSTCSDHVAEAEVKERQRAS